MEKTPWEQNINKKQKNVKKKFKKNPAPYIAGKWHSTIAVSTALSTSYIFCVRNLEL